AASAAALLWAAPAAPEGRAAGWLSVLATDDGLTVISPQLSVRAPVGDALEVELGYDADVITAASADVIAAASPRGYTETRHGVGVGATWRPAAATSLGARYLPSFEGDYESQGVAITAEREWIDRRLTTQVGYRFAFDEIGRRGDAREAWRSLDTHGVTLALAWVFGPRTVGQISYEGQILDGYQASPYRFVPVDLAGVPVGVPERAPDDRARHAVALGLRHAITPQWFTATSDRVYADTWGIVSHTEEIELQRSSIGGGLILGAGLRLYGQTRADFYERRYAAPDGALPRYRTADKMLAPSYSLLAGPRIEVGLGPLGPLSDLRATAKIELYVQRFIDYDRLTGRRAVIPAIGIAGEL
ncbi:MAG: DUF3570 domain-containing protein, partial [Polyangiaceae bacterium]|nr:DUF3570 domain-containing protein [Polyangiaceae bacterium]